MYSDPEREYNALHVAVLVGMFPGGIAVPHRGMIDLMRIKQPFEPYLIDLTSVSGSQGSEQRSLCAAVLQTSVALLLTMRSVIANLRDRLCDR